MKERTKLFCSPSFLIALMLLLLNDFILKGYYGNWLTGKLSDFSGLFVFSLFWAALIPKQSNKIFVLTGLLFIYWKSPFSEGFINIWNIYAPFAISRVVDLSDLMALSILPFAYLVFNKKTDELRIKIHPAFPAFFAFFAFCATSQAPFEPILIDREYTFHQSSKELIENINKLNEAIPISAALSLNTENATDSIVSDLKVKEYSFSIPQIMRDTHFTESGLIDTVYTYTHFRKDSIFLKDGLHFDQQILISKSEYMQHIEEQDEDAILNCYIQFISKHPDSTTLKFIDGSMHMFYHKDQLADSTIIRIIEETFIEQLREME